MSQSNDFFGAFISEEAAGPFVHLPYPGGEIFIGAFRSTFEFGIPGFQRISFIRTWEAIGKGQTKLLLTRGSLSLEVTRFPGCGVNYPPRFIAHLTTDTFMADIRFCPMDDDKRISGVYHVTTC
jgi:hypothetical protein